MHTYNKIMHTTYSKVNASVRKLVEHMQGACEKLFVYIVQLTAAHLWHHLGSVGVLGGKTI